MEQEPEHTGENGNKLKKLLRELPRAKASPDFEARLAHRVNQENAPSRVTGIFDWLGPIGRIPAPVYSLAGVVILGVVSYYAFFRSGSIPAEQRHELSELRQEPPKVTDQLDANKSKERPQDQVPATTEGKGAGDIQSKQKKDAAPNKNEAAVSHPAPSAAAKAAESDSPRDEESGKVHRGADADAKGGMTQERAQGVDDSRLKKPADQATIQKMIVTPQGANAVAAPQMEAVPGQKEGSPNSSGHRKASAYSLPQQAGPTQSYGLNEAALAELSAFRIDSVRIRDSIRADSLRRARADSMKLLKP